MTPIIGQAWTNTREWTSEHNGALEVNRAGGEVTTTVLLHASTLHQHIWWKLLYLVVAAVISSNVTALFYFLRLPNPNILWKHEWMFTPLIYHSRLLAKPKEASWVKSHRVPGRTPKQQLFIKQNAKVLQTVQALTLGLTRGMVQHKVHAGDRAPLSP